MKKTKALTFLVTLVMLSSAIGGCASGTTTTTVATNATETTTAVNSESQATDAATTPEETISSEPVTISLLNTKSEIQTQLEDAAKAFNLQNPNITVEVIISTGTPFEKLTAMYASDSAPTIAMLDGGDLAKIKDRVVDLSSEKWVSDTPFIEECKVDGTLVSFPLVVEGVGLIYNKAVLEKAGVDPAAITTQAALEDALIKIEATGVAGAVICKEDWSLGNHLSVIPYTNTSRAAADVKTVLADLKAGTLDLTQDKAWNGFVDTLDILMKYNLNKETPLNNDYNKSNEAIATGKAGFLFQGVWAWPDFVKVNADINNFGYIPYPISNDAADICNTSIQVGATKFLVIDKDQNSVDQQIAAKRFLNWLVYDPAGQTAIVTNAQCISPFTNVTIAPENPLAKSVASYIQSGNILVFTGNLCPSDHWSVLGGQWQKYVSGNTDRASVAKEIMTYWQNAD